MLVAGWVGEYQARAGWRLCVSSCPRASGCSYRLFAAYARTPARALSRLSTKEAPAAVSLGVHTTSAPAESRAGTPFSWQTCREVEPASGALASVCARTLWSSRLPALQACAFSSFPNHMRLISLARIFPDAVKLPGLIAEADMSSSAAEQIESSMNDLLKYVDYCIRLLSCMRIHCLVRARVWSQSLAHSPRA